MNEENKDEHIKDVDVSFEEINDDGELSVKDTVKKLREKIKILEKEKQEYLDLSQRTRADYVNYKKEVEDGRIKERKFATKRFVEELLPVLDAYDMAKGNEEAWGKVDSNWRIGIEYIFTQFKSILEKEGMSQFGKVGDKFDPMLHEAMEHVEAEEESHDMVVKLLQSGYKMHDTILRPARVHIGQHKKD